eukprot:Hpha_TRINITY_DN11464_c0_g1::TRINITY_DN11464_c0_g1_i1::g.137333::m.137333
MEGFYSPPDSPKGPPLLLRLPVRIPEASVDEVKFFGTALCGTPTEVVLVRHGGGVSLKVVRREAPKEGRLQRQVGDDIGRQVIVSVGWDGRREFVLNSEEGWCTRLLLKLESIPAALSALGSLFPAAGLPRPGSTFVCDRWVDERTSEAARAETLAALYSPGKAVFIGTAIALDFSPSPKPGSSGGGIPSSPPHRDTTPGPRCHSEVVRSVSPSSTGNFRHETTITRYESPTNTRWESPLSAAGDGGTAGSQYQTEVVRGVSGGGYHETIIRTQASPPRSVSPSPEIREASLSAASGGARKVAVLRDKADSLAPQGRPGMYRHHTEIITSTGGAPGASAAARCVASLRDQVEALDTSTTPSQHKGGEQSGSGWTSSPSTRPGSPNRGGGMGGWDQSRVVAELRMGLDTKAAQLHRAEEENAALRRELAELTERAAAAAWGRPSLHAPSALSHGEELSAALRENAELRGRKEEITNNVAGNDAAAEREDLQTMVKGLLKCSGPESGLESEVVRLRRELGEKEQALADAAKAAEDIEGKCRGLEKDNEELLARVRGWEAITEDLVEENAGAAKAAEELERKCSALESYNEELR